MRINPVVRVLVVGASALVCSGAARAQSPASSTPLVTQVFMAQSTRSTR